MWQVLIILTDKEWKKSTTLTSERFDNIQEAQTYLNALINNNTKNQFEMYYCDYLLEEIKK